MQWVIGIDEAGRGPLAGPVYVASACVREDFLDSLSFKTFLKGIKDSKKLSASSREKWRKNALEIVKEMHPVFFKVSRTGSGAIDNGGIESAVRKSLSRTLNDPRITNNSCILLDGRLRAPKRFKDQQTIIKGDEKIPLIALASIFAKVERDTYMRRLASSYPHYGFESNSGYGTSFHIEAIKAHGLSDVHRKTYCKRFAPTLQA